jgi:protein lifeguard
MYDGRDSIRYTNSLLSRLSMSIVVVIPDDIENQKILDESSYKSQFLSQAENSIRRAFARKVFSIVAMCLLFTATVVTGLRLWDNKPAIMMMGLVGAIVKLVALLGAICFPPRSDWAGKTFLSVITVCFSFVIAALSIIYQLDDQEMIFCVTVTAGIVGLIALIAVTTDIDFTGFLPILIFLPLMLLAALVALYILHLQVNVLLVCCLICGILGLGILIDIQLILGGGRAYEFTVDEYWFAAAVLYIDIVQLFIEIMRIVAIFKK